MAQYVYLLHTREFRNSHQPIYKIGRTKQSNFRRFGNYERGFVMLFQSSCRDCALLEKEIIRLFTIKYVRRLEYGREYFEGDQLSMMGDLCDIVRNEGVIQDEGVEEPVQGDNGSNDTNNNISTTQDTHVSNAVVEEITEYITQNTFVLNTSEDEDDIVNEGEEVLVGVQRMLNCIPCGLSTDIRFNYAKNLKTKKHVSRMQNPEMDAFECMICFRTFDTNKKLRNHEEKCRAPVPVPVPVETELRTEVDDVVSLTVEISYRLNV